MNIAEIAHKLNHLSSNYKIGNLQNLRKEIKHLKRSAGKTIFQASTISDEGWAFHFGGRKELQFNIGLEEEGLRYGLAFSFETSRTLPNADIFRPKILKLNSLIQTDPQLFDELKMWQWQGGVRSEMTDIVTIDPDLIQSGTFIFFGKINEAKEINYQAILRTFDDLLHIYTYVETMEEVYHSQLTKLCILKPVMWNTLGYKEPSGFRSAGGFSHDHGYGHEEWNNNDNWIWRNFKIFHTESQPNLLKYSSEGNLGIVMTSSHKGKQYAVGIATNVYHNDSEERSLISSELNTFDNYNKLWQLPSVKKAFNNDKISFLEHWKQNHTWIQWKCPVDHYQWFDQPVLLDPLKISGKSKLISMHSSYQKLLPQLVLETLFHELTDRPKIINWLTTGDFDVDWHKGDTAIRPNTELRKKYSLGGANAPATRGYSYWVEGLRNIEPLHAKLQSQFVNFLSRNKIKYIENKDYIDVQYTEGSSTIYCEIKPTLNLDSKYAIRIAIGQLLEYQYFNDRKAKLEIVISSKPRKREIEFATSLNIRLTYLDQLKDEFISCNPPPTIQSEFLS